MKYCIALLVLVAFATAMPHFEVEQTVGDTIPGLMLGFGSGYDIVTERTRAPFFTYTYEYEQQWTSPFNGQTYNYPDQTYLNEIPEGKIIVDQITIANWSDYVTCITSTVGVSVGLGLSTKEDLAKLSFQRSHGEMDETISGGIYNFGLENRFLPFYQLDVYGDTELSPHISAILDKLPDSVSDDADQLQYQKAIQSLGTHVVIGAQFGGFLNISSVFEASLYKSHSQSWVAYQVGLSIAWDEINLGINVGRNKSEDKLDENFEQNCYSQNCSIGGNDMTLQLEGYDAWLPTIYDIPGMVPESLNLSPLHYFIDDATKAETMRNQIIYYIKNQ